MKHFSNFSLGVCLVFFLLFFGIGVYKIVLFIINTSLGMPEPHNVIFAILLTILSIVAGLLNFRMGFESD